MEETMARHKSSGRAVLALLWILASVCMAHAQVANSNTALEGVGLGATIIKPIVAMSTVLDWGGTGLVMGSIKNINITNQSHFATSCIHYHPTGTRSGNNFSIIQDVVLIGCNTQGILMDG